MNFHFHSLGRLKNEPLHIGTPSYSNSIGTKIDYSYEYYRNLFKHRAFQDSNKRKKAGLSEQVDFLPLSIYPFFYNTYQNIDLDKYLESQARFKLTFNQIDFRNDPHHSLGIDQILLEDPNHNKNLIRLLQHDAQKKYDELLLNSPKPNSDEDIFDLEWLRRQNPRHGEGYILVYSRVCNYLFEKAGLSSDFPNHKIHFIEDFGFGGYHLPTDSIISDEAIDKPRTNDCLITGQMLPHIYPFRSLANEILEKCNDIKTVRLFWDYLTTQQQIENQLARALMGEMKLADFHKLSRMTVQGQRSRFIAAIRNSKTAIGCSSVFGYPLKKYFEYMANGCVVVGQMPINKKELGFKHLVNVYECQLEEVPEAIKIICKDDELRIRLARNAKSLVENNYTMLQASSHTVKQFNRILSYYK